MNVRYVPESQLWLVTGYIDGQYVVIMNTNMMAAMSRFREMQDAIVFRDVLRDMTLIEAGGFVADGSVDLSGLPFQTLQDLANEHHTGTKQPRH